MRSFRYVLMLSLAAGAVSPATAQTIKERIQAKLAQQGVDAAAVAAAKKEAAYRINEGSVRSVTYSLNGQEVTRYYQASKEGDTGALRLAETDAPGGNALAAPQQPAASAEWAMSQLGYTRTTAVESRDTVIAPDGKTYELNSALVAGEGALRFAKDTTGPGGEIPVRTDSWRKGEGGYVRVADSAALKTSGYVSSYQNDAVLMNAKSPAGGGMDMADESMDSMSAPAAEKKEALARNLSEYERSAKASAGSPDAQGKMLDAKRKAQMQQAAAKKQQEERQKLQRQNAEKKREAQKKGANRRQ